MRGRVWKEERRGPQMEMCVKEERVMLRWRPKGASGENPTSEW